VCERESWALCVDDHIRSVCVRFLFLHTRPQPLGEKHTYTHTHTHTHTHTNFCIRAQNDWAFLAQEQFGGVCIRFVGSVRLRVCEKRVGLCECAIWLYVKMYSFTYSMGTVCVCVSEKAFVCACVRVSLCVCVRESWDLCVSAIWWR